MITQSHDIYMVLLIISQQVYDITDVMRFQMTGHFDKLQLSATVEKVTYRLYAATAPQGGYGTLTAVSDSQLEAVQRRSGGTCDFAFQRPIRMHSSCQ